MGVFFILTVTMELLHKFFCTFVADSGRKFLKPLNI